MVQPSASEELDGLLLIAHAQGSHADLVRLYTRAADKVEAATGVQLGRTLDLRG